MKAGLLYFVFVFGVGFVVGIIRTLWIVPRVGTRTAELIEIPVMLLITIFAAKWIVQQLAVPSTTSARLSMGCIALGCILIAEFTIVIRLRGLSIRDYLASRDPGAATAYYVALALFAFMPMFVARS
jgi:hypothetical protein